MRTEPVLAVGLILVCLLPGTAYAQAAVSSGAGTLDGVAMELRLLRQVLDKHGAAAARAQLLIGRLTLQDQRTARAQQRVDRLEGDLAAADRERNQQQHAEHEVTRTLEQTSDQVRRAQLESEQQVIRTRLVESQTQLSRAQGQLARAKQVLDVESSRYDELDGWLRELDRQLQAGR